MQFRLFKMRFRRKLKQQKKQVKGLSKEAEAQLDKHVFKRISKFAGIRRFVLGWTGLVALLIAAVLLQTFSLSSYYQTVQAVDGGIYREGMVGNFTTANPLYATSEIDNSVAELVFAGLFQYNQDNQMAGDLASRYEVDTRGITYTVHLKPNLTWHDGKPVTSRDVLFTYQTIQNPDAQSPLRGSWQDVVIEAPDPLTVTFKLPSPLSSFPQTLVNGIVPAHLLSKVAVVDLRTSDFNTVSPIGAGPFSWQAIEVEGVDPEDSKAQIALLPFNKYHDGSPQLDRFVLVSYANKQQLVSDFKSGQLSAIAGLDSVPSELRDQADIQIHNLLFTAGTYAFLKTTSPALSGQKVRQALVQATEPTEIISKLDYPTRAVRSPLLKEQLAYDPNLLQLKPDLAAAKTLLDQDGWIVGKDGFRTKDGKRLTLNLAAADTAEYRMVANELKDQWKRIGVQLQVRLLNPQDFQNALQYHDYDVVVYSISLGTDPDAYVYWHSKQADVRSNNRLNLSEYSSAVADEALESGRTRLDPQLRTVKYQAFLQAWQQDAPAVGLYQPRSLYITSGNVSGFEITPINTGTDRFRNVENWQIRQAKVPSIDQ